MSERHAKRRSESTQAWMASTTKLSDESLQRLDAQEEAILNRVARGDEIARIAWGLAVSIRSLNCWVNQSPERKLAWEEAKVASADSLLGLAARRLRSVRKSNSSAEVAAAKNEAEHYRWLATKRNRQAFDDRPLVHIGDNVSIAQLHLSALQNPELSRNPDRIQDADFTLLPKAG